MVRAIRSWSLKQRNYGLRLDKDDSDSLGEDTTAKVVRAKTQGPKEEARHSTRFVFPAGQILNNHAFLARFRAIITNTPSPRISPTAATIPTTQPKLQECFPARAWLSDGAEEFCW